MTTFGEFARERVRRIGKSQKALALELEVSPAYVSQVFSGKKNPPDLGRPRSRALLKKWAECLETPESVLLEKIRFDLHHIPPRPGAKFGKMRELLCARLHSQAVGLVEEIRSMAIHPAENLAIQRLVQVYLVLQEDLQEPRGDGPRRFRDLSCRARADREFVEGELFRFFAEQSFAWSWDPDNGEIRLAWKSSDLQQAMETVRSILEDSRIAPFGCTVPVVAHVSAGEGFAYTDGGFAAGEGFEQVELPPGIEPSLARILYCVRVRGDSLRDFLCDGALLFIKPESWEEIKDGDLVIFKDRKDRRAFVKKVEFAGENLILKPMNSLYKNMVLHRGELDLLERVTAIVL
jgi:transcriptional regulator with XRE-family HTH domain